LFFVNYRSPVDNKSVYLVIDFNLKGIINELKW